jgi:hypothetical protein
MLDVDERFLGRSHAAGNLPPNRLWGAIALTGDSFSWPDVQQLAIQGRQPLELLAASRTDGKVRVHPGYMLWTLRLPAGCLEHFRYLRCPEMFVGVGALFQN